MKMMNSSANAIRSAIVASRAQLGLDTVAQRPPRDGRRGGDDRHDAAGGLVAGSGEWCDGI